MKVDGGELVPEDGQTGVIVWKMRSPYLFVGGKLDVEGTGARFSVSWDGKEWVEVEDGLDALFHFPHKGNARYEYRLKCELPAGSRLGRLGILNDLQMAPLALPGMAVGENQFTYSDQTAGARKVRRRPRMGRAVTVYAARRAAGAAVPGRRRNDRRD